jgi:PhoPQ-activated pathogenicity-related protein
VLHDVPNQPLIRPDLVEDNLIAHTFVQFWETGDATWPLLFPMVKSAVRAMDAVQAFAKQEWRLDIKDFVVTGASKRGWTTWLTAAVDDRVRAIAPMVFDNLNFFKQMPHQIELWGRYSEQISEYYERGLMEKMLTERGRQLVSWVDPYSYRARYTMPILIINGANDPYWATDAAQFYFNDLPSKRKYALYVPNGGHGLGDYDRVVNSLCAFYLMSIGAMEFPTRLEATHSIAGDEVVYRVRTDAAPELVEVWVARRANDKDFRPARWDPVRRGHTPRRDGQLLPLHDTRHRSKVDAPPRTFTSFSTGGWHFGAKCAIIGARITLPLNLYLSPCCTEPPDGGFRREYDFSPRLGWVVPPFQTLC